MAARSSAASMRARLAALLLLAMTLVIGADVVLRNVGPGGIPGATRSPRTSST